MTLAVKMIETYMKSGFSPTGYDLVVYILLSGITSVLGARLAVRYFNL